MTQWTITCWDGGEYNLPTPLAWKLSYGLGSPCDSFQVICPWTDGQEQILADGMRLTVKWGEEIVFRGVVDECECTWSQKGSTVEIVGRGLQALLLDNQTVSAEYGVATLEDILRRYVSPYGIALAGPVRLPAVAGFSVRSGSSCWQALYQFARYYSGVTPRFDREGRLLLTNWDDTVSYRLDDKVPLRKMVLRDKRYGVLSQVQVINRVTLASQTVRNEDFLKRGGCSSKVLTMPRTSGYQALRYNGQFQLDQSASELRRVEITVAEPFLAQPGALVSLDRSGAACNGTYRVLEAAVWMDEEGYATTLQLGDPNAV